MKYAIVHIADIHYSKNQHEGVSTVIKAFLKDLIQQKKSLSEYKLYLAITGDIIYAGKDSESYDCFRKEVNEELNNIGLTKEFRIIVPGNHDIDQDDIRNNLDDYEKVINENSITEQKFNNLISNKHNLNLKFENYELFESDFAKYGVNFSPQGHGWKLDSNFGVYCLNTALTSFGRINDIDDEKKLSICTRELVHWCNKKDTPFNILLMHHPVDFLNEWSRKEIKTIIENNFTLGLCGHDHEQDILYNKISQKSLICSSPQLYTDKNDKLGYAIILIQENIVDKIIYRQYDNGVFLNGSSFSRNDDGIVLIQKNYDSIREEKNKEILEQRLSKSLATFKNQPEIFIKPKLSKTREFNNDESLLDSIVVNPVSLIITAQPQFGLTCLSHFMTLEAYKKKSFWIYLDANILKSRKIIKEVQEQAQIFDKGIDEIECIIVDSWNSSIRDHQSIISILDNQYKDIPIIIMLSYSGYIFSPNFDLSKLEHEFSTLHLQALQRDKIREFVCEYNKVKRIAKEDEVVTKVVKDLEALNIHRTPLNCATLLKVFEKDFNNSMINRTKMIKSVLFILFTDTDSFTYLTNKPDVDDVEYILGKFCSTLIKEQSTKFIITKFKSELKKYSEEALISIDVNTVVDILESNNILLRNFDDFEFKHRYWIYYFAASYMLKDNKFRKYILEEKEYINYPQIIEFYTGIDGRRKNAIKTLLKSINDLTQTVNDKIGISEEIEPFNGFLWNPSEESINAIRKDISEKVMKSNLPTIIKDQHADESYNSEAPYNQSINNFFNEFEVLSLMQSIKASSRALRNSNYIKPELKREMLQAIMNGWAQISRVIFWISPVLASRGKVSYDGLSLVLQDNLEGSFVENLKSIYLANPLNVVNYLKDDISSKKIGPVLFENLEKNISEIQKHFISLLLAKERPIGWYKVLFEYMNLLHKNSFYLGNLYEILMEEIKNSFANHEDLKNLKNLVLIVTAKYKYAPKGKKKTIPENMTINKKNKLPIDKIITSSSNPSFKI